MLSGKVLFKYDSKTRNQKNNYEDIYNSYYN